MPRIYFVDVTNRDGVQASRLVLSKFQRTMVNFYLGEMGLYQSEFCFPVVRHELNYIKANLELGGKGVFGALILQGWVRAISEDVEQALATGVEYLNLSISTSDQMITHKFRGKLDRSRVIKEMTEAVICAKEGGIKAIGVNAEDASRTDLAYLIEFALAAKEAGAKRLRYCDTLGCESPFSIYERIKQLAQKVKIAVELHCHNDLGMAVANSIAGAAGALEGGQDTYINTTVNGIGERAGQADLVSCILALSFAEGLKDYELGNSFNLEVSYRLARYVAQAFGIPIPVNQPGVGANAFAHESGIHADGTLKDRKNYELYDFEVLGRGKEELIHTGRVITTGNFGGLAGLKHVYANLGITFPDNEKAQTVLELVQVANEHNQAPLTEDELRFIAHHPEEVHLLLTASL